MSAPFVYEWDGEAMKPLPRFAKLCDKAFVVGETYSLVEHQERSDLSHRHYFAAIREAWMNLPDELAMEFPNPEALRKRALIDAGYFEERRLIASSPAEARKFAAFLKPTDDFAVVAVAGNVVVERKAKSQSYRAMGKKDFHESKTAVLDTLDKLLGVDRGAVEREGRAA